MGGCGQEMQLNPSLLDSVRGESDTTKGCRCVWGSWRRKAKGERRQEGEEITMESLGDTQQRAGEKTIKREMGGTGNTEQLSQRQGESTQCGQQCVEGRGLTVGSEEEEKVVRGAIKLRTEKS